MKKIFYLSMSFLLSFAIANAQGKANNNQGKVEEVKSTESNIIGEESLEPTTFSMSDLQEDPEAVYSISGLQIKPSFPGSFHDEVLKGINTADNGAPSPFKGRVYVNFIIEKDGSLSNIRYARDPGYGFGEEVEEAIRKVKKKWSPGIYRDKPVRVKYTLPVLITIP